MLMQYRLDKVKLSVFHLKFLFTQTPRSSLEYVQTPQPYWYKIIALTLDGK